MFHTPQRWDVQLARWFDTRFPPLERHRTFARPGRRQEAMGGIPAPSFRVRNEDRVNRTFGLVLDTCPNMDRQLLQQTFEVLNMQSVAHEIERIRLIVCDKMTYDEGFVMPEHLREHLNIKGLKHPPLQPGVDLLDSAWDFPAACPIIFVTDGACDALQVKRDHAFIMPVCSVTKPPLDRTVFWVQ